MIATFQRLDFTAHHLACCTDFRVFPVNVVLKYFHGCYFVFNLIIGPEAGSAISQSRDVCDFALVRHSHASNGT